MMLFDPKLPFGNMTIITGGVQKRVIKAKFKIGGILISVSDNENTIIRITSIEDNYYLYYIIKGKRHHVGRTFRDQIDLMEEEFRAFISYPSIWSELNGS